MNGFSPDFTELHLDEKALTLWRRIDAVGRAILKNYGMDDTRMISQVPIVLSGMNYGEPGMYSAGVRPFLTEDFMTGEAALAGIDFPEEAYEELVSGLLAVSGIVRVEFDITDKPGATTERR
jgi:GMP synthase (glutamine-hydrolysing)